jgi:N-methylhydantoinase B
MRLGSVMTEIMSRKFSAVTDEMTTNLKRSSRSIYVKEAGDFGVGLADLEGHIFAFPTSTSVSAIERPCGPCIRAAGTLEPGDVIISNDPYRSQGLATHLPDLHLIKPYFHNGKIIAYGWCFIHFMDVGGRVPSSISPSNTEIFQEGLIVPPLKLMRRGEPNAELMAIMAANCRLPEQNIADIKAMLGALDLGGRRIEDLIAQYGAETFVAAQTTVQDYAAAKAREVLRTIPDGVYEFWDYLDDDMLSRVPVRFRVRLTVRDGEVELDATGTDPQVISAYNLPTQGLCHPWLVVRLTRVILTHEKNVPLNYGLYRHFRAVNPPGTILNAQFPDAVGVRQTSAHRFHDAMTGALMKACPELMSAPSSGIIVPVVVAESDPRTGLRHVSVIEPLVGGTGGHADGDGVDARENSMANLSNHPLEVIESEIGVVVREYDVRTDSGGPGEFRGGTGQVLTFELLHDDSLVFARGTERMRFVPWGYGGGGSAAPLRVILNRGRADERELGKLDALAVNAGDTVTFLSPGGGGFGDPFRRKVEKVLRDVRLGFVSRAAALRDYGVALTEQGELDKAETERQRAQARPARPQFDMGTERGAWEAAFDDATMQELNAYLAALPKSVRRRRRRAMFEAAVPALTAVERIPFAAALADPAKARARLHAAMQP